MNEREMTTDDTLARARELLAAEVDKATGGDMRGDLIRLLPNNDLSWLQAAALRAIQKALSPEPPAASSSFDRDADCPICGMNEECSHTVPERRRAWEIKAIAIGHKLDAEDGGYPLPPAASLGELRALSEAATEGPWKWDGYQISQDIVGRYADILTAIGGNVYSEYTQDGPELDIKSEDAAFIIAAVNHVRALLARAGAL